MAGSPSMPPKNSYHVRSISLPSRSHPLALRAGEEINKLRTWETSLTSSSETISNGLGSLENLYNCVEDFLQLPLTQQAIAHHRHEKWVEEVLDGSVRLLDVCGATREILSSIKERVQAARFAFRRRSSLEVNTYIRSRKKAKKDVTKLLGALKQMDNKFATPPLLDQDQHLSMVVKIVRELRTVTISVIQATLSFLSASRSRPSKWSLVSKLMHKGLVAREGETNQMNEFENADVALSALSQHMLDKNAEVERIQTAQNHLGALELGVVDVEARLECVFRRLIQIRVSLLNILSC
ncbi:hypothetical protein MRB53_000177 [Persea americana]|uniref:Uncharacterized protein n=1 Tax=Persea americana TaxID=3435 RepID=A0ACC2MN49_PERAE|nr:hypothetical protein MRB53_000177 [Persea americana]